MSRHSQQLQARKALQNAPRPAAAQPQQQLGIDQLVPLLLAAGAKVGFALQTNDELKAIQVVATCGAIAIPVAISYDKAREMITGLTAALEKYDPQKAAEDAEALKGDYDDDDDELGFTLIADEASGVPDGMFDAIEALEPSRLIHLP